MKFRVPGFRFQVAAIATLAWLITAGCATVSEIATGVLVATGDLNEQQAASINRSVAAVEKTFQDITPEQEYYIGRAVAATILKTYRPFDSARANEYVNLLGQTLAQASKRPETFGGWHFQIMDTDEINAFAAPGGLVLVSRGLLRCCRNEDMLAAVLAHEISHVVHQHGLKAIKKGRLTSALTILAVESAKSFGGEDLAQVTEAFEGTIGDITSTLMNSGYARTLELEADRGAVEILRTVGYNPQALVDMLREMKTRLKPGGKDFAKTHPDPDVRIRAVQKLIGAAGEVAQPPARQKRFEKNVGGV